MVMQILGGKQGALWFRWKCYHPPPGEIVSFPPVGSLFPLSGTRKETISHPWTLSYRIPINHQESGLTLSDLDTIRYYWSWRPSLPHESSSLSGWLLYRGSLLLGGREISLSPVQNGRNIVTQQLPTLLDVTCCVRLRTLLHVVGCCCVFCAKFETGQTFQPTTSNISFVPWSPKRSATMLDPFAQLFQQFVGATHAHYAWITKTYGLYSSHDELQVPNLLGVVASVCTPLPTRTQQLPTLLAQQCWELLRPFARSLTEKCCDKSIFPPKN